MTGWAGSVQQLADGWFNAMGVRVESKLVIGTLQGMKTAVRAGAGVALASKHAVRDDDTSLARFQLANPPRRSFFIVRRDGGWESQVLRSFHEFAESLEWLEDILVVEGSDTP